MVSLLPATRTVATVAVVVLGVTVAGVAGPAADHGSGATGAVLWRATAEQPTETEWASSSSEPGRISRSGFRAEGARSYRVELRDGDDAHGERAELGQAMPGGDDAVWFHEGQERWIAMQYHLPTEWPRDDTWQTILQIKPVAPGGGGPDIGLGAGGDRLTFYGNSNTWGSTAGGTFDGSGPLRGRAYRLPRGRWMKLTWHVVFSADPGTGSLEVFGDLGDHHGMRRLVPLRRRATMKLRGGEAVPVHLRVGIYRDPAITAAASLHVDGITVATTREAAEAGAYGRT